MPEIADMASLVFELGTELSNPHSRWDFESFSSKTALQFVLQFLHLSPSVLRWIKRESEQMRYRQR